MAFINIIDIWSPSKIDLYFIKKLKKKSNDKKDVGKEKLWLDF